ncbi:MAG: DegT/DnrJ/EryC1/StrS family aminotransferase [Bdellovibrionales bacterium]|nr:DegT/DnrJ/EryC1/StrS family aminotransferase [Bdellovibrionales bacterium]
MIPFIDLKAQYNDLKTDINQQIQNVLEHGQFILGPEVKELESQMSSYLGVKHSLTCASGTDALLMALMALDIKPGDEVITPNFSFFATAEVVAFLGATPVFVDVDKDTYNISVESIEKALSPKTKAIIPVSLYGQMPDMDAIMTLADHHDLYVIEDAAQSFGAGYLGRKSGSIAHISCTSFFPAKPLGCYGDGGAVFTNSDELKEKLEIIRNHGQTQRYHHEMIGINGRLDTMQCAILLTKLAKYDWEVEERQKVANKYNEAFEELKSHELITPVVKEGRKSVWAQYTLAFSNRDAIIKHLNDKQIPTSVHYPKPLSEQPALSGKYRSENTPNSFWAAESVFSLPMHPYMKEDDQQQVIEAVKSFFK